MHVDPSKVAFVLEVLGPDGGLRTVDIVFAARDAHPAERPRRREAGLEPAFVSIDELYQLDLRPPLAGHLRRMAAQGGRLYAPYLANLWRPPRGGLPVDPADHLPGPAPEAHGGRRHRWGLDGMP